ncbi:MAG: hypothetical protein SFY66_22415 [Oculatellaceae cyanobacterium bins.114]|nr:hypothetical protein [Oculatellaceae cyanobacterium bins.114]
MKLIQLILIAIVFIVNLGVAHPALADRPPIDQNPDYVSITETLTNLTQAQNTNTPPEGLTMAEVQQQITNLQYQKYLMETGKDTICRNDTTQTVAIYGAKPQQSTATFDQVLFLLPAGEATDDDFACQGVYLPNDVKVAGVTLDSAAAIKILDGTQLVLTENPDTGAIALNLPPASVFKAGEVNWEIPDLAQADLTSFPTAPLD